MHASAKTQSTILYSREKNYSKLPPKYIKNNDTYTTARRPQSWLPLENSNTA
jgi:hypothetical protein